MTDLKLCDPENVSSRLAKLKSLLLSDPPAIHGQSTYGIDLTTIDAIASFIASGSRTMEIGAGISTIVFALLEANHTSVTPCTDEIQRLRHWMEKHKIPLGSLVFESALSWDFLPTLKDLQLDFAFIDGCHGFPAPFIDFFYLARNLREGGVLGIDDIQLWTGRILVNFLQKEKRWEPQGVFGKTAFFRKVSEPQWFEWEWDQQQFVVENSRLSLALRLHAIADLVGRASRHLWRGDWKKLQRGLKVVFRFKN